MIVILCVAAAFIACGVVILYLVNKLTKTKGLLFAAKRDATRARARMELAKKAAKEANERCQHVIGQLDSSISATGQAISVARHIEIVSGQLQELLEYVGFPADAAPARHALYEATPRELPETYTRQLPYMHGEHLDGSTVSLSNGTTHYISEGN